METNNDVIKLPDEIINKIKEFQERTMVLVSRLGDINLQQHNLQKAKEGLLNQYDTNIVEENNLIKEIETNYGLGSLDIKTGLLTKLKK